MQVKDFRGITEKGFQLFFNDFISAS